MSKYIQSKFCEFCVRHKNSNVAGEKYCLASLNNPIGECSHYVDFRTGKHIRFQSPREVRIKYHAKKMR